MKIVTMIALTILLLGGCQPAPQIKSVSTQQLQKWAAHQNKETGFMMKIADGFKKVSEDKRGVCFSRGKLERIAMINWEMDMPVYKRYLKSFASPKNFQDASSLLAFEELGAEGSILLVEELKLPEAQAFLFYTKHRRLWTIFYRTRIEIFSKHQDMQTTVFFQYLANTKPEIDAMIKSIVVGTQELPEDFWGDTHHRHHHEEEGNDHKPETDEGK